MTDGTTDDTTPAEGVAPRPPLLKRLVRSRVARAVTAAGLVGVLLGAGTVAWRTETLPLLGSTAPCWDTFDEALTERVFGDRETVAETQRLGTDPNSRTAVFGQCRITSYKDEEKARTAKQLTVQVRRPAGYGRQDVWPDQFLGADMVPLGSGLPGMVSPVRAWLALPESCTGRAGILSAPTVVDLASGDLSQSGVVPEYDRKDRAALAEAVVAVANGVLRELGCSGTYPALAPDKLPDLVGWQDAEPGAFCGVKGLSAPAAYSDSLGRVRVGPDGGAARTCEAGGRYPPGNLRLTTVIDPTLAQVFADEADYGGTRLDPAKGGPEGFGSINVTRGVYLAHCQTGEVAFVIERMKAVSSVKGEGANLIRALLPKYVEAEAERIGCGPIRLKLPEVLE
ncbi:hypothetical protein PV390_33865 [Streptomyces sp. ME02-6991-2A]|uniref:hypothetical protein n=1 Tax=Streptomyces sp. ME02-6991-2A TaxID=3028677 RepID=UPI0029AA9736|nr:hypothetical protein [Streptomyces sp. ME02-6991-2A]MDX3379388.1 hypothetical protein [Streptomyces sp. ME02-6991-2A]